MLKLIRKLVGPAFTPGLFVVVGLALVSSAIVALTSREEPEGIEIVGFAWQKHAAFVPRVERWNRENPDRPFVLKLLSTRNLERRMLSGFLSGTPLADMLDTYEEIFPKAFLGPIEHVGFLDLTDRIHAEGLYEQFNEPSFSHLTYKGRIFGLPQDVHPVLLAYRSDIVEAAGIDVSQIETWDDYFRAMRPLMADRDGDGLPDHYALSLSDVAAGEIYMLIMQNDGTLFDEDDEPNFATERNAWTLAKIMTWITGPERATFYVQDGSIGNKQRLDGLVIGTMLIDPAIGMWKIENPGLAGKVKLMPLPAFEKGGRRTSVIGGSMMSINKRSPHIDACWEMTKELYMSAEVAESTWRIAGIVSPVKALWKEPFYHEPDPFLGGQSPGTLFIEQAPHVPRRPSSPYSLLARARLGSAAMALRAYAERHDIYDIERLQPEALRLLKSEEEALKKLISRNRLLEEGA
ncbi:hypothetical protein AXK11_04490, partial [Cephaloticoccus primus]